MAKLRGSRYAPPDVNATRYTGYPSRVKWSDPESNRIILELTSGATVVGTLPAAAVTIGEPVEYLGRWEDKGTWGYQFLFEAIVRQVPTTRTGVVRRLTARDICLGETLANKLFDRFGSQTLSVLKFDYDSSVIDEPEDRLLNREHWEVIAKVLRNDEKAESAKLELFELFHARGFAAGFVDTVIMSLGLTAPILIRNDAFCLLDLPSAGFRRCDRLFLDLGGNADSLKRRVAALVESVNATRDGSTWHELSTVLAGVEALVPCTDLAEALDAAQAQGKVSVDGSLIATARGAAAESAIAVRLRRLMAGKLENEWPVDLPYPELTNHQRSEALKALASPVGILCGSPGTGKSFTLAYVLKSVIGVYGASAVKVAAPTGKAAVRATESMRALGLPIEATTLHRLLGSRGGESFTAGHSSPIDARFIVIDEASMIGTSLMRSLLDACGRGTHILFIGDPDQLPPVDHGCPLRDMLASAVPRGTLTEIQRFAGRIVRACAALREGREPSYASRYDPEWGDNLVHVPASGGAETLAALQSVIGNINAFTRNDIQVLCGVNAKGELSRGKVNAGIRELMNPHGDGIDGVPFRQHDRIICLKNRQCEVMKCQAGGSIITNWITYRPADTVDVDKVYVANGEMGNIVAVGEKYCIAHFPTVKKHVKIPVRPGGGKRDEEGDDASDTGISGDFDLAFCITTHKAQGAESPCVIVLADPAANRVADRNWWYTAISRASQLCIVIGPLEAMRIQQQRAGLKARRTRLSERIGESVESVISQDAV